MKRADLPLVTLDGRHAGELLAHPCACGRQRCTLGDHIWQSTRDMTPGPKAQSFEPPMATGSLMVVDSDPRPDPMLTVDAEFADAVTAYWHAARDLTRLIDRHRPDRWTPLPEPASDSDWCRNHLETIGLCEPRHRGDLCRWCYELGLAHGHTPDRQLMETKRDRYVVTDRDIKEWQSRIPKSRPSKKRRKKAS